MTVNLPPSGETAPPIYNGRYELRSQIARGGTAQVYLARDLLLDRPVALKVLFPELSSDSSFVERFRREAQAAANLSHPNIVPVFDWGESDRTYFIVMEHVDGEPLSAIIRSQAPLPALRAAAIGADIAKALSYAHRHGVVHRDVKPGNVLITRDGQVKVADFGIARAVGTDDSVTQTGLVMGTATYFSPEQAQGLGVDGRSDVYSLGVVLYEMVTGRAPFVADTPVAIAYKHVSESPIPPRELEPRLPAPFEAIIMRAMAKNPADRYATAEDLHADLQRFMQGATVLAPMVTGSMPTEAMAAGGATTALQAPVGRTTTVALGGLAAGAGGAGGAGTTTQTARENGRGPGGPLPSAPVMPRRRWIPWTIAAVLLLAALVPLVDYGARQLGYLGGKGYFYMPPLGGRSLSSALTTLKKDGVTPNPIPLENKVAKGTVLSTRPTKGTQVQKGQTVAVYYSSGPGTVPVPLILQESLSTAEHALTAKGLNYHLQPVTRPLGTAANLVVNAAPQPGTQVPPGSYVTLYYTSGVPTLTVAKVYGDTVIVAQNKLAPLQTQVTQQLSATVKAGLVITTNPLAGTQVPDDSTVTLIVSEGPGDTVPPVVGDNYVAAEQAIRKAGLNPQVTFKPSSPIRKNIVLHEAPPGGTQQAPGTTVTLTVGQGPLATVTVTNPGPQTSPANTAISGLQIVATDSASNPLTFSATGLPPGLSISATGMISGTPTTPGPYTVTVTATDTTTSATGTATFPWMVTPGGGGGGQVTPSRAQSPELTSAALRARRTVTAR